MVGYNKKYLSEREREFCHWYYVTGGDIHKVCEKMSIAESTYRSHIHHIFDWLGVQRGPELMKVIIECGIVDEETRREYASNTASKIVW